MFLKKSELSTVNNGDVGVCDKDKFCGILHIASTIKQQQVNNSPVVSLLIVGIFCLFNP
jgi:hypothetical protein